MSSSWADLASIAPLQLPPERYQALLAAYATPERAYHSWQHVRAVLLHWHDVDQRLRWRRPRESFVALLYHDAVYEAGRSDNEKRSAKLVRQQLGADSGVDLAEVERLVLLTARHGKLTPEMIDAEAALFLDCDMAILGAPAPDYLAYREGVRTEYAHVPSLMYRRGRRTFLERLLARPRIFLSDDFHGRLDAAARANIRGELANLG
jgi:predicted metal-dependent HD superfamily phosphohydrolase